MEKIEAVRHETPFDDAVETALRNIATVRETEAHPFEIPIRGPLTAEGLKKMMQAPVELSITEQAGRFVLSSGEQTQAFPSEVPTAAHFLVERHFNSKLSLHSHPIANVALRPKGDKEGVSLDDVNTMIKRQKNLPGSRMYTVGESGIHVIHDITPEDEKRVEELLMLGWNLTFKEGMNPIEAGEISNAEKRRFIEATKSIQVIPWDDVEGIERVLADINGVLEK